MRAEGAEVGKGGGEVYSISLFVNLTGSNFWLAGKVSCSLI